uniref:Uncharacterized protein n=1 Tax=Tanacetum cinerariifolium TaxID=118510 RepID=A0A699GWS8_TANCI|nr:hypothetical protein [Tanacetum cinerariifolium]
MTLRVDQINLISKQLVILFHLELQGNVVLVKGFYYLECWTFQIRFACFFFLILLQNHVMNDPISPVLLRSLFSSGSWYDLAKASAQLFLASGKSVRGMIQPGSGVSSMFSSGTGFNQSGLVLVLGRCETSMSSESDIVTSSGIGTSSMGCLEGGAGYCLEELERASLISDVFQVEDYRSGGCFDP